MSYFKYKCIIFNYITCSINPFSCKECKKKLSPVANPDIHQGSNLSWMFNDSTEDNSKSTLGIFPKGAKFSSKDSDKGLFNLFIKDNSFKNPGTVACSLLFICSNILQKDIKFLNLEVCNGYFSKCAIITFRSCLDLTLYRANLLPVVDTEPTPLRPFGPEPGPWTWVEGSRTRGPGPGS